MKTIYKYDLKTDDNQVIQLPKDREILCVQLQQGRPKLWVKIDYPSKETEPVRINTYGTGHIIEDREEKYIGTYQLLDQYRMPFVLHVFEDLSK